MTNTQKPRYEIETADLETLSEELKEFVASGEYPKYDTQSGRKTYVITGKSLKGFVLRYIREIKTKAENKEKCVWKTVSENDLEKIAKGEGCITLGPNKPCYKCEGTGEYAKQINCDAYHKQREK